MHKIVLVSPRLDQWRDFVSVLETDGRFELIKAVSGADAITAVKESDPFAMAIDSDLEDIPGIELIKRILPINAMINVALVSDLPEEDFHESTEGLGILMQLSVEPTAAEAGELVERLGRLTG